MSWIEKEYSKILQWARNITKGDPLSEDLAHYCIESFMTHPRYEEVIQRHEADPNFGHARAFMLSIMRNSWFGNKSAFSRTYKIHRADIGHRKRVISDSDFEERLQDTHTEYDYDKDRLIEGIEGILEELELDMDREWFGAKLFRLWLVTPNYSKLARQTGIPRTTISSAIDETKALVRIQLKERGLNYDID